MTGQASKVQAHSPADIQCFSQAEEIHTSDLAFPQQGERNNHNTKKNYLIQHVVNGVGLLRLTT